MADVDKSLPNVDQTVVIEPQKEVHLKMPTFNIVVFAGDYAGPEVRSPMLT